MSGLNKCVALIAMFTCLKANAGELSLDWDWQLSADTTGPGESLYVPQESHSESVNALLDVEARYRNWTGLFAVKADNLYHSDHGGNENEFIIQELFVQEDISLGGLTLDYLAGKVRLDWGVGYGYRPLDIFKPYRRNPVGIQVEEGAGTVSLSYFDMQGEWSLLYADSSWNSQSGSELEESAEQQGFGLRRYWLAGDSEYQWLAYYDDVRHGIVGGSLVTVLNESWEVHGSLLYQNKYLAYGIPTDLSGTTALEKKSDASQGLAGLTWASESGHQIIVEYWYDSRSWSQNEWNTAHQRVVDIASLPDTGELRYTYANGFNHANLVQHNMMFHWSLDGSSVASANQSFQWLDGFTPTLDIIYSPSDSGIIATHWLNYLLRDTGESSIEAEVAARFYTGDSGSVYANLPNRYMITLNLRGRF